MPPMPPFHPFPDVRLSLEEQALLEKIEGEVQREFEA